MEVRGVTYRGRTLVRFCFSACLLLLCSQFVSAQKNTPKYLVKNGKMYIEVSRNVGKPALDSFITKFDLADLSLHQLIENNNKDALLKSGWHIESINNAMVVISKAFGAFDKIRNYEDKILFAEKHPTLAERFPAVNNGIVVGYNRFRNKSAFTSSDSIVTFFLRNNQKASRVMLAGSFNSWYPDELAMSKTDSGWIYNVKLGPGKYWYKFIVDGNWIIDNDNLLKENDGQGNTNSIFFKTNAVFMLNGFTNASKVFLAGSFNKWRRDGLQLQKTAEGWALPLYLAKGTHTYKFVVDGQFIQDDNNKHRLPDGQGGYNSVITIGTPRVFTLNIYKDAKQVVLAGSFNNWRDDELLMHKIAGGWQLNYTLGPGNYEYRFKVDGKWVTDPANPQTTATGTSWLVIDPNYKFRLTGYANATSVFIAGDFNNWSPAAFPMKKDGDTWVFPAHLSIGKHGYKFVVDGKWIIDPANKFWEQNEFGTGNSVLWIEK